MAKVLALVERDERDGTVRRSTCALLTLARRLGEPVAVMGTAPDEEMIRVLGHFGATEIWCLEDAGTEAPTSGAAAALPSPRSSAGSPPVSGPLAGASAQPRSSAGVAAGAVLPDPQASSAEPERIGDPGFAPGSSMAKQIPESADVIGPGAGAAIRPASETDLLTALAHRLNPAAVLIADTHRGQETAARLAIRLDSGIITDAVDLLPGTEGEPVAIQHCLAGSYFVESSVIRGIPIITVRPEAAVPESHPADPALRTIAVEPGETRVPWITATAKARVQHPDLDQADIVVAGGRGVGSRAAFAVLAEVADALGAAVAGSHTAAELGWIPAEARVGLTGKTVHPSLYLACGVSGSVRHRAGMQGAKTVVAIGDDPAAPIFKLADLGVVGDARAILPALLKEIRTRTQSS